MVPLKPNELNRPGANYVVLDSARAISSTGIASPEVSIEATWAFNLHPRLEKTNSRRLRKPIQLRIGRHRGPVEGKRERSQTPSCCGCLQVPHVRLQRRARQRSLVLSPRLAQSPCHSSHLDETFSRPTSVGIHVCASLPRSDPRVPCPCREPRAPAQQRHRLAQPESTAARKTRWAPSSSHSGRLTTLRSLVDR